MSKGVRNTFKKSVAKNILLNINQRSKYQRSKYQRSKYQRSKLNVDYLK
jgi:hypothetical protein